MASVNKVADRIMQSAKVIDETGCWEWLLSKQKNGYGQIKHEGKMKRAHRVSFEAFNGEIPVGLEVMHTCDNRSCVNPKHLICGTHSENMKDIVAKSRQRRGENHPYFGKPGRIGSKSKQSKSVEINGVLFGSQKEAERALNVSHGSVRYWIKTGKAKSIGATNGK